MSERERFERYAKARSLPLDRMGDGRYRNMHANEAWQAWQAACPKGWQCVPVEPTGKMRRRALSVNDFESGGTSVDEFNSDIYLAMLSAAPKPEDAE